MVVAAPPYLAEFEATVHRTKNRLVAVPAAIQRELGLKKRGPRRIVDCLVRPRGRGRWQEHLAQLTANNEFRVPFAGGRRLEIRVRSLRDGTEVPVEKRGRSALELLHDFTAPVGTGRRDGARNHDKYLYSREAIFGE